MNNPKGRRHTRRKQTNSSITDEDLAMLNSISPDDPNQKGDNAEQRDVEPSSGGYSSFMHSQNLDPSKKKELTETMLSGGVKFAHPLAPDDTVTIIPKQVTLKASDLSNKTEVGEANPREWIGTEYRDLPLYELLKHQEMQQEAFAYTVDGGDTFYISNGGTRRICLIDLFNTENIDRDYPMFVFELTSKTLWVADLLTDSSDYNQKFSLFENSRRLHKMLQCRTQTTLTELRQAYRLQTGSTLNSAYAKAMLIFYSLYLKHGKDLISKFKTTHDINQPIMKVMVEVASDTPFSKIDIYETVKDLTVAKGYHIYIQPNLSERLSKDTFSNSDTLIEILAESEDTKDLSKRLKEYLNRNKRNKEKDKVPNQREQAPVTSSPKECAIQMQYSRTDYDSTQMKKINLRFEELRPEIEAFVERIDTELKKAALVTN